MIYRVDDIIRDVRVCLDENRRGDDLFAERDVDTLELDVIIASHIEEGARRVVEVASVDKIHNGHSFMDAAVVEHEDGSGSVALPDDFMRLLSFRMGDWVRTLHGAITADAPEYEVQQSRFGVRGCPERPVCAYVVTDEGKRLEYYTTQERPARMVRASYAAYPRLDEGDESIDLSEDLYVASVYMIAALTLITLGDGQKAQSLMEILKPLI